MIDTATNKVIETVEVGKFPFGITITPNGNRAYVANQLSRHVSVIDTRNNTLVQEVEVGVSPFLIAIPGDTKRVFAEE